MTDLAKIIYFEAQRCAEANCFTTVRDELKSWFTEHFDSIGFDSIIDIEDAGDYIVIMFEDEDGQDCEILANIESTGHTYYIGGFSFKQ